MIRRLPLLAVLAAAVGVIGCGPNEAKPTYVSGPPPGTVPPTPGTPPKGFVPPHTVDTGLIPGTPISKKTVTLDLSKHVPEIHALIDVPEGGKVTAGTDAGSGVKYVTIGYGEPKPTGSYPWWLNISLDTRGFKTLEETKAHVDSETKGSSMKVEEIGAGYFYIVGEKPGIGYVLECRRDIPVEKNYLQVKSLQIGVLEEKREAERAGMDALWKAAKSLRLADEAKPK